MSMGKLDFSGWVQAELNKRGWRQADLSRESGISESQIARVLTGTRSIGPEGAVAIARAFMLPPEAVFRQAGLLPEIPGDGVGEADPREINLIHLFRQMDEAGKDEILAYAEWKFISEQRRNKIADLRRRLDDIPPDRTDEAFKVLDEWMSEIGARRIR